MTPFGNHVERAAAEDQDRRSRWGRLLRWFLGPIYYHLDLRGADGRPSHAKLTYTAALVVGLAGMVWIGKIDAADGDVSWGFLGYVVLVLAFALGKQVFNHLSLYLVSRFGDRALAAVAQRRSGSVLAPMPTAPVPAPPGAPPIADERDS